MEDAECIHTAHHPLVYSSNVVGFLVILTQLLHMLLMGDFFYYYFKRWEPPIIRDCWLLPVAPPLMTHKQYLEWSIESTAVTDPNVLWCVLRNFCCQRRVIESIWMFWVPRNDEYRDLHDAAWPFDRAVQILEMYAKTETLLLTPHGDTHELLFLFLSHSLSLYIYVTYTRIHTRTYTHTTHIMTLTPGLPHFTHPLLHLQHERRRSDDSAHDASLGVLWITQVATQSSVVFWANNWHCGANCLTMDNVSTRKN